MLQPLHGVLMQPVHSCPEDCPQEVSDLIDMCLQGEAELRPTAKELVVRLQELSSMV